MSENSFIDLKTDFGFKKLFTSAGNQRILQDFLRCLLKSHDDRNVENTTLLTPFFLPNTPRHKHPVVDVMCDLKSCRRVVLEMQNKRVPAFAKRIVFYGCRAYTSDLEKGEDYSDLRPIVVISVCNFRLYPDKPSYISHYFVTDSETSDKGFGDVSYILIELPKFDISMEELNSDIERWIFLLKNSQLVHPKDVDLISGRNLYIKMAFKKIIKEDLDPIEEAEYTREKNNEDIILQGWLSGAKVLVQKRKITVEDAEEAYGLDAKQKRLLVKMLNEEVD